MSDFSTVLIEDSRIANITDKETFAVMSGAAQSTYQEYISTSTSSSAIVFNCQIPSENIVVDRHLLVQSTVTLTLTLAGPDGGGINNADSNNILVFDYGLTDSLQAFPINSLCNSQQCSINNTTISQNTKDILPMILKMYDKRKLNRYNSICPSLPDSYYANYVDGLGTLNNVLAGYNNQSLDEDFTPRGGFPVNIKSVVHTYIASEQTTTTTDNQLIMPGNSTKNKFVITLQFTSTEPFIALSPWTNTNSNNQAGLCGINNISFNLSIDSTCKRVFSTMNKEFITSISLGGTDGTSVYQPFTDTKLLFNFLSLQPESYQKISSKNCIPYLDFPRFLSTSSLTSGIAGIDPATGKMSSATLTSNNLQLSQIPDLILICVRKPITSQNWTDSSSFLKIDKISINFNNSAGLLSSANSQQLYLMSYKNGSGQSFFEFNGYSTNNYTGTTGTVITNNGDGTVSAGTYAVDVVPSLVGKGQIVSTTGSLLVINPVLDLNLPSYLSNSSLGQFNFTFTITVSNQFNETITPEICVITVNSGIFTTQLGSSVINTGILTKEEVLKTKEQKPIMDTTDYKRYIGGSLSNMGMSNVLKLFKHKNKTVNDDKLGDPIINHGSGLSGGSMSGGRIKRHIR